MLVELCTAREEKITRFHLTRTALDPRLRVDYPLETKIEEVNGSYWLKRGIMHLLSIQWRVLQVGCKDERCVEQRVVVGVGIMIRGVGERKDLLKCELGKN